MKKIFAAVLFMSVFVAPLSMNAQESRPPACGTTEDDLKFIFENMKEMRARYGGQAQVRNTVYIPVWFHLVAKTDGTGRVRETRLLDMLCEWNRIYTVNNTNMQFYIKGFNYINNDALYNFPRNFGGEAAMINNKKTDGMNIFITANADDQSAQSGQTLGYYANRKFVSDAPYTFDWIVIIRSQVSTAAATTVAHEAGHFFSLPHTFNGWESGPFAPTVANPCAPTLSPGGVATERVARTGTDRNCETAGDGFCDTPEDYNLGFGWNGCNYTGIAKDPQCIATNPDETLSMGYFIGCGSKFSNEQIAAMQNNYQNVGGRAYLRQGNITPSLVDMTAPTLNTPASAATTSFFNNIQLDWTDVPGATAYVVEVSKFASFDIDPRSFVTTTSAFTLNSRVVEANYLQPGVTFYWRVRPFGNYKVCGTFTASRTFVTGTVNSVNEIPGVTNFSVNPNPVSKNRQMALSLSSENAFAANIKIYNVAGQIVHTEKRNFDSGFSTQSIDVSSLNAGMFILTVESENGILNKKIVITD